MPSKLYQQMNQGAAQGNADPIGNTFFGFMQQMRGQNPRQIINQLMSSGQMTQQQLNILQQKSQELSGVFGQFKAQFGF